MNAVVVGIDPGGHGAISGHDESGGLLWVVDMPSTREANGRTATNAALLAGILARTHARVAFCDFVGARQPTRGLRRLPSGEPAASLKVAPARLACRSCS